MDFDDSSYLGCLLCADHAFCTQIVRVLEANLNKPIRQIGSLDISVFYKYRDEYRERVQAMLDEKSKGQEITITAPKAPQCAQIIDLMQALKQSTEKAKPKQKAAPASASEKRLRQIRNTRLDSSIYSSIAPSKNGGPPQFFPVMERAVWESPLAAGLERKAGRKFSLPFRRAK